MERRKFLESLALLPALAPLIRLEESPTKPSTEEWLKDSDTQTNWKIKWHGWYQMPTQHCIFGYWWARNEEQKLQAFSACPGDVGYILDGQMMNSSVQKDQIFITPDTPVSVAEEQQKKALTKLIHFLKTRPHPRW